MNGKICVVTGTRADYGILFPVLKAIDREAGLTLQVIATSMHLMKEFGYTVKEIRNGPFKISAIVDVSYESDTGLAMAGSFGKAVSGLAKAFDRLDPDIVVVLGDRGEMLAAAIAANYLNIPVAHIHGGEVSGHIDGVFRHAITKLAHIHFPATRKAGERIIKLGEDPRRVFVTGAPALDRILNGDYTSPKILFKKYGLKNEPILIVVQHPVITEAEKAGFQMREILEAVKKFNMQTICIYPNADAGGRKIIGVLKRYAKVGRLRLFKNLSHEDYVGFMRIASVLIGNSSSGIIEAPSFGLPVVNIGRRQLGRGQSANMISVPCRKTEIIKAIDTALNDKDFKRKTKRCRNPYGDGYASGRIAKILSRIDIDEKPEKRITY